jgi:hypothetical protein
VPETVAAAESVSVVRSPIATEPPHRRAVTKAAFSSSTTAGHSLFDPAFTADFAGSVALAGVPDKLAAKSTGNVNRTSRAHDRGALLRGREKGVPASRPVRPDMLRPLRKGNREVVKLWRPDEAILDFSIHLGGWENAARLSRQSYLSMCDLPDWMALDANRTRKTIAREAGVTARAIGAIAAN